MTAASSRLESWPTDRLHPAAVNPRRHGEDDLAELAASIRRFGFRAPILATPDGEIVAGEGRWRAAVALGLEEVPVVPVEGLSADERQAYLLADNRVAELSVWDDRELADALEGLDDLDGVGFTDADLEGLLAGLEEPGVQAAPDPAQIPVPEVPVVQVGGIWTLGRHRVVCGDATHEAHRIALLEEQPVDLVVTDPPYAIFGSSTGVSSSVADDRMVRPFFAEVLRAAGQAVKVFGHVYTFGDWRSWAAWWDAARSSPLTPGNLLVWDKGDFGLGSHWRSCWEGIGFWQRLPVQTSHMAKVETGQRPVLLPNVIRHNRTGQGGFESEQEPGERYHNAAKPVDLLRYLIRSSSDKGQSVLDLFLGSGSTLLAAELEGRDCRGLEIEPGNVEVTIGRWERLTGQVATGPDGVTLAELQEERDGQA